MTRYQGADDDGATLPPITLLELLSDFLDSESDQLMMFLPASIQQPNDSSVKYSSKNVYNKGVNSHALTEMSHETSDGDIHATTERSHVQSQVTDVLKCTYCTGNHNILACNSFLCMSIGDKWSWVRKHKICARCLKDHRYPWSRCRAPVCGESGCRRRHHRLLHTASGAPPPPAAADIASRHSVPNYTTNTNDNNNAASFPNCTVDGGVCSNDPVRAASYSCCSNIRKLTLLKVVPVVVSGPNGSVETYALLDDGSTATFVDAAVSRQIGATGPRECLRLDGVGGMQRHDVSVEYVNLTIRGKYCSKVFTINNARSITSLNIRSQTVEYRHLTEYSHLKDIVEYITYENAKPLLLIGVEDWHLTITKDIRAGSKSQPVAILTALGWVLHGCTSNATKPIELVNSCNISIDVELDKLVKSYFDLDSIGIIKCKKYNEDDQRALNILQSTSRRLPSGHFEVGLLWRHDEIVMPDSYGLAIMRLKSLERKLNKNPILAHEYSKNVQSFIDKGYAEKCLSEPTSSKCWYLPHFGVTHPLKPNKIRVVHDAAAKIQNVSLNSMLLKGPDYLQSLLGILFRFREGRIAITADIKEFFLQIKVKEEDRDSLRFLWREAGPNSPIAEFRMTSVIFGAASSPCTALYIKNKNALEHNVGYPEACDAIIQDHYMDNYIGSMDDQLLATRIAADINIVQNKAGFEMRDWASNEPAILSAIPIHLCLPETTGKDLNNSSDVRILGLVWNPRDDTFSFKFKLLDNISTPTKRNVLKNLMRVYDPLGLLGIITIRGRILFQNIWRSGIGWDDLISSEDLSKWKSWLDDLASVTQLHFPRWYSITSNIELCELHVFADASEYAYATVAYFRYVYADGNVKLSLIGSKARVASLKLTSIPRLELQAAIIAARFGTSIIEEHKKKPRNIINWSDSKTVLYWLRSDIKTLKPFVAHRVTEITEITDEESWRWLPSGLNVADDATRHNSGSLDASHRWFTGPPFLFLPESEWPPKSEIIKITDDSYSELKALHKYCNTEQVALQTERAYNCPITPDPCRFSTWLRFLRATARVYHFIQILRKKINKDKCSTFVSDDPINDCAPNVSSQATVSALRSRKCIRSLSLIRNPHRIKNKRLNFKNIISLSVEHMKIAELLILRRNQSIYFSDDLSNLNLGKLIQRQSRLKDLSPFLDENGIIRMKSRIGIIRWVEESLRFPIILDGRDPAIKLLIYDYHEKAFHGGNESVINEIRQKYWILSLRNAVRGVARNCQVCKIRRAKPLLPITGDLPFQRLDGYRQRPFTYCGIDHFGPLIITVARHQEKRYVALFTCLNTRAIHLEIAESLSADATIMCLRRFFAKRGCPKEILSDNGTSFVAAAKQLELFATNKGIKWSFIPPLAPNMGGTWERMVRSVKNALSITLKQRAPREEVLRTLLAEAENIINSRPLTYVAVGIEDTETLTPNHFLIGTSSGSPSSVIVEDRDLVGKASWRKAIRLSDYFWQRWLKEYVPTLLPCRKPNVPVENLAVGDLVIIADGNMPRGVWPRAVVVNVYPGKDQQVRVVDVKTTGGIFKRATRKVIKLPV